MKKDFKYIYAYEYNLFKKSLIVFIINSLLLVISIFISQELAAVFFMLLICTFSNALVTGWLFAAEYILYKNIIKYPREYDIFYLDTESKIELYNIYDNYCRNKYKKYNRR